MNYETRKVVIIFLAILSVIVFLISTKKDNCNSEKIKVWATI